MADDDYAIVFSGGGALGAWEVGCLQQVIAHHGGKDPVVVTGASAGALNAAGFCAGLKAPELEVLWKSLKQSDVYALRSFRGKFFKTFIRATTKGFIKSATAQLKKVESIYDTTPLKGTLDKILKPHGGAFLSSNMSVAISSTNLTAGSSEIFYKIPPGKSPSSIGVPASWKKISGTDLLVQALMGTTALPILFPPMEGHFDGGVLLNQPISPAMKLGALNLFVFIPASERLGRTRDLFEIGSTLLTTWLALSLTAQIQRVKLRNEIRAMSKQPKFRVCVVRPLSDITDDLGVQLLSFGSRVDELIALGRQNAQDRLARFDPTNEATWY